ncbi:RNA polymerase subunit sigma-24 [Neobacillus piezotolerans]|uniref:RNA polymerase subunit sigma-24 n=1 Tax=Neobacillus piezotolerans TaxID=2259171 RepID=A0A3D8GUC1_9BACI|nr:RNA polymerase sigma factor [Neobacillus piezotolerans]RDU38035.1 RNA polymerase subunit sigma-24 [Neobacillus piezotolerans]
MTEADAHRTIEAIWRIESARLIAGLTRLVRDVGLAEDLAHDALIIAMERWPESGIPDNPGAWLMTTAKRRAFDMLRRNQLHKRKYSELIREMDGYYQPDFDANLGSEVEDDLLRLIFMTCHPILSREARIALALRLWGGLTTLEIARAFLISESTVAQRIVRAKRTLRAAQVPFDLPEGRDLEARLASVLEVLYLIFNEGYSATSGEDWIRPVLCEEALRLGRILAELVPKDAEVHGLVSLMEIQSSRFRARIGESGEPILLEDQNRVQWDQLLIRRGLDALERAESLGGVFGPYRIQAEIAACHAKSKTASETDWLRIAALYDALGQISPSPIVELNRAVALSRAFGPEIALEFIEPLMNDAVLKDSHQLPSVRGDLLAKLGRNAEAFAEFTRAASLTRNERERELLLKRASNLPGTSNSAK